MGIIKTNQGHYVRIAAAIRTRLGTSERMSPAQMANAISLITGPAVSEVDSSKLLPYPIPTSQSVITDEQYYAAIADAIRAKNGTSATYKPGEMMAAILAIATDLSVTVNLPAGMEERIQVEFLSGGASMEAGEQLSLRVTSRQAAYLLSLTPAATMGGQEIDLTSYITYDASVDGMAKQYTISNLPVTGDFALDVSGGEGTAYLRMAQAANGACSVYGAQTPAAYRQPGGSVRLAFTPDAGCGIPDFAASDRAGLYTDCLTFLDYNTGQALDKASFLGRTSLISGGGAYYVQHDAIAARDVITRIEFSPIDETTTTYTITRSLTNVTASNATASVAKGGAYSVTLTPESGYEMSSVKVTMGGTDITSSAYTASTGRISIASVTGNIVITATATKISVPSTNSYTVEPDDRVDYTFTLGDDGWYINNNQGVHSSAAMARIRLHMATAGTVTIQCINYGEASWDFGYVSELDTDLRPDWNLSYTDTDGARKAFNMASDSSTAVVSLSYDVPAGDHFIAVKYKKDGSGNSNGDYFKFKVVMP